MVREMDAAVCRLQSSSTLEALFDRSEKNRMCVALRLMHFF